MKLSILEKQKLIIRESIFDWKPFPWVDYNDDNEDEFDGEINAIAKQIPRMKSPVDTAHVVARVFSSSFSSSDFNKSNCLEVGKNMFDKLNSANLLK